MEFHRGNFHSLVEWKIQEMVKSAGEGEDCLYIGYIRVACMSS